MFSITLSPIGHLKDAFYRDTQSHYAKLLAKYSKLQIQELADVKISTQNKQDVIKTESQIAKSAVKTQTCTVVLDKAGKSFDSQQWAEWLRGKLDSGTQLQFFIGGPYGFSPEFTDSCHEKISLSKLTLPHQLARIILLEQLYRGFTIIKGVKYHY